MNLEIETYIKKRYERWNDYAIFHTTQAGLIGENIDVLNEVLFSLLKKNETKLLEMLHAKKGQYCELDFFVLNMVKMNILSDTAPYRAKNKPIPKDSNVDYSTLEIEDTLSDEPDLATEFLEKYNLVCEIVDRLDLTMEERDVFFQVFINNNSISSLCENNTLKKKLYDQYITIKTALSVILFQTGKTKKPPRKKINGRSKNLVENYFLTKIY